MDDRGLGREPADARRASGAISFSSPNKEKAHVGPAFERDRRRRDDDRRPVIAAHHVERYANVAIHPRIDPAAANFQRFRPKLRRDNSGFAAQGNRLAATSTFACPIIISAALRAPARLSVFALSPRSSASAFGASFSLSAASAVNGRLLRFAVVRRDEFRAGLARIGIEAQHHEFGGQRAEIDLAVDDRIRRVDVLEGTASGSARPLARASRSGSNLTSTGSSRIAGDRLERHDASLRHRAREPTR